MRVLDFVILGSTPTSDSFFSRSTESVQTFIAFGTCLHSIRKKSNYNDVTGRSECGFLKP